MRYHEILESVNISSFLNNINHSVNKSISLFVDHLTSTMLNRFDQDYVIKNLDVLFTESSSQPIINSLLNIVSDSCTKVLRQELRKDHSQSIFLHMFGISRQIIDCYVVVWNTSLDGSKSLGTYHPKYFYKNGFRTVLEVVVSDKKWLDYLKKCIKESLLNQPIDTSDFVLSITNSLVHEYSHMMQDINGMVNYYKTAIKRPADSLNLINTYEIDSHATGAAAEVIQTILKKYQGKPISNADWNREINQILSDPYNYIPEEEYIRYIDTSQIELSPDDFQKVKQRFIKKFIIRLRKELR